MIVKKPKPALIGEGGTAINQETRLNQLCYATWVLCRADQHTLRYTA